MQYKGYLILAEWHDETLTVTAENKMAAKALAGKEWEKPVVIRRADIASIGWKSATMLVNGRLTITTNTGTEVVLHFRKKQMAEFAKLREAMESK